ncbi:MAG TPA: FtsW/RodA/SpoVE family cell cycle protein, partial [Nitrospira sp.]
MAARSAGTLSLPWPSSGQRPAKKLVAMDHTIFLVTLTLALVGLVMVFSASAIVAGNRFQDPEFFLKRQIAWMGFGFLLMHLTSRIDYVLWKKLSMPILACMLILLVMVLIPGIGVAAKGARRWLRAGPISVQPAEMVKLVTVIYLASYLTKKSDKLTMFRTGLFPALVVIGLLSGLVLLEPDLGTVVVIGLVTVGLLFLGGAKFSHLLSLGLCAIPTVLVLVLGSSYRRQRLMTFLAPWKDASDAGFQITQSFLAFGSGGPFGVGLGEGKQKL